MFAGDAIQLALLLTRYTRRRRWPPPRLFPERASLRRTLRALSARAYRQLARD